MTLTTLEQALIACVLSLVVALVTHLLTKSSFVTKEQCAVLHGKVCEEQGRSADKLDILFRMMRAFIAYSDLPPDKKAEILNERGVRE